MKTCYYKAVGKCLLDIELKFCKDCNEDKYDEIMSKRIENIRSKFDKVLAPYELDDEHTVEVAEIYFFISFLIYYLKSYEE